MKSSGTTNTVLTFVLAVLVLAGVYFALRAIFGQRQLRTMRAEVVRCQSNLAHLQLLMRDAVEYGKTHPDIKPVLEPFEAKPASHRTP